MKGHVQWEVWDDFTWVGLATIGLLKACVWGIVDKLQVGPMISEHTEPRGSSLDMSQPSPYFVVVECECVVMSFSN